MCGKFSLKEYIIKPFIIMRIDFIIKLTAKIINFNINKYNNNVIIWCVSGLISEMVTNVSKKRDIRPRIRYLLHPLTEIMNSQ